MNHLLVIFLHLFCFSLQAQFVDQGQYSRIESSEMFLKELKQDSTRSADLQLLPKHYPFTQKLFWGEKGLMRKINGFELNEQNRLREVKWRSNMLKAHKVLGYASIVGMAGMAYTGVKLYNGDGSYEDLHSGFAVYTNVTYFTSGSLMLFAPPWQTDRVPGYSNIKLHKYLSFLHMGLMATALLTADGSEDPGFVRDLHRASAFGAFGVFFVSTVILEF